MCSGSVVVTAYDSESGRPSSNPEWELIYYEASITAQGLPEPSSIRGSTLVTRTAEHKSCNWGMQVDWWLQPCAVFDHSFSGISSICHRNEVNSIAWLYIVRLSQTIVSFTLHYIHNIQISQPNQLRKYPIDCSLSNPTRAIKRFFFFAYSNSIMSLYKPHVSASFLLL